MILPALKHLLDRPTRHPSFKAALDACRSNTTTASESICLGGLSPTAKMFYASLFAQRLKVPVVVVVKSNTEADQCVATAKAFFELLGLNKLSAPFAFYSHDVTPYDNLPTHPEISAKRAVGLWKMANSDVSLVITTITAALQKLSSPTFYRNLDWSLEVGDQFFLEELEHALSCSGYSSCQLVEMVGQFSVRGGIVDIYPPEKDYPVRLEMLGDQLESIRLFDAASQKSLQEIKQVTLLPLIEYCTPRKVPSDSRSEVTKPNSVSDSFAPDWKLSIQESVPGKHILWDLLGNPVVIWNEKETLKTEFEKFWETLESSYEKAPKDSPKPLTYYHKLEAIEYSSKLSYQLEMSEVTLESPETLHLPSRLPPRFKGDIAHAMREIQARVSENYLTLIMGASLGDVERLADILSEYEINFQLVLQNPSDTLPPFLKEKAGIANPTAGVIVTQSSIREGVVFPEAKTILYGKDDLFGSSGIVTGRRKINSVVSTFLPGLQDLIEGNYVVHVEHGIGVYRGTRKIEQGGRIEEFMLLEYADRARLYLPLSRLDLIQKYHGSNTSPPIDRMGGQTWQRTKARVKSQLLDMADELLKLYAERKLATGHAFSVDSNWQREFEDAFDFTETPDQLQAITDIKRDMESEQPMDRLVCGDVGFGKTEVAMRAVFKALGDGKQAAVLTPTTVLSLQHYQTFLRRFSAFPIEIEMLSRFRKPKEQKNILERLSYGQVDVVIGTHRLLSKDVIYSDLGLLVVDEEHRFGVRHKERIKKIKKEVDVLTLSATPIPRTLHMSFAGLRDLSLIQTPPKDRLTIHTVVAPYSEQVIATAIHREIDRGGQVYFIHNRVESIWEVATKIRNLAPKARIGVGHGQMTEKDLERVMLKLINHEYDIMVATTIVENGLDIPLANTIIINHADQYGLAELYQLRGRVGRSDRRAYAFLLVDDNRQLSETARKRLAALKGFSELGAGFKIAALDLELRGAGNLLGSQQHGQIASVGFETYCRMLDDTISELQGRKSETFSPASFKLQLDLHIPSNYIHNENNRLQYYKRLAEASTEMAKTELLAELKDRYGEIPLAVENLASLALLKALTQQIGIESIERRGQQMSIIFRDNSKVKANRIKDFVATTPSASFSPSGKLQWKVVTRNGIQLLEILRGTLIQFSS